MADDSDNAELLNDLVERAMNAGADAADAVDIKSIALSHAPVCHLVARERRDGALSRVLALV